MHGGQKLLTAHAAVCPAKTRAFSCNGSCSASSRSSSRSKASSTASHQFETRHGPRKDRIGSPAAAAAVRLVTGATKPRQTQESRHTWMMGWQQQRTVQCWLSTGPGD